MEKLIDIDIWKVGNKNLGWYITNSYNDAYEFLINSSNDDELEIIKDEMTNTEYEKLDEFSGF